MTNKKIIVAASGYFDPFHVGHLKYLELAKELGDKLVVIVNNDNQAKIKKGYSFMNCEDRKQIIGALGCVDEVFESVDQTRPLPLALERGDRQLSKGASVVGKPSGMRTKRFYKLFLLRGC